MTISELLNDKTKKAKERTQTISQWLLDGSLPCDELIAYAEAAKDVNKATCIEAFEYATKQNAAIADERVFAFVTKMLAEPAPRVKMESGRVIANIAHRFPTQLESAIPNLLANAEYDGTVVRWAAALALGEILKLKTPLNVDLLPTIEALCNKEEENGVKSKYVDAIKKAKKK